MAERGVFVVVAYDIPDDDRRLKLSQFLENFGQRVQKSVFECYLTPEEITSLRERVGRVIKASEDNVRYYRLCETCRAKAEAVGPVPLAEERGYFMA